MGETSRDTPNSLSYARFQMVSRTEVFGELYINDNNNYNYDKNVVFVVSTRLLVNRIGQQTTRGRVQRAWDRHTLNTRLREM